MPLLSHPQCCERLNRLLQILFICVGFTVGPSAFTPKTSLTNWQTPLNGIKLGPSNVCQCMHLCVRVCVFVPSLLSVDTKRQPSAREQRRERGEKKQANSPFLSNYKWQTCYQESVWHLTTHDNLSALCQYSVTDWRLCVCVCVCLWTCWLTD